VPRIIVPSDFAHEISTMPAYGYIRLSVVHDDARKDATPPQQEAAIRALAKRHDDDDVILLQDIDRSGKLDRRRRAGWDQLLTAIESGEAHAVYAYSLSRFARSVPQLASFAELCDRHGVKFRVDKDNIDTSTASGKLVFHVIAALAQFESDVASERIKDSFAAKRAADPEWRLPGNWAYGTRPSEDSGEVVRAFDEAQSYDGAARLLNERAVPSRRSVWHGSTVRGILARIDPDRFGRTGVKGVRAGAGDFRLSRLLACGACGTTMTPSVDSRTREVRWYCRNARVDKATHGRGWVSEKLLLATVEAEADHAYLMSRKAWTGSPEDNARADELEQRRERVLDAIELGLIAKDEARDRLDAIAAEARTLSTRRLVRRITLPALITDKVLDDGTEVRANEPREVNEYLRRLFESITVDDMATPAKRGPAKSPIRLSFAWRDPTLRAEVPLVE